MMIRRMKQWAAILTMACMMAIVAPAQMVTAFAAGAKITFSDPSAKVGSQFKVNMKLTNSGKLSNADIVLAYDSNALDFVSGTNAEGGAGAVRVHGDAGTPDTGSMTFTLNFKALASGSSKITVTSQEIYDGDSKLVNVDHQGDATVTVGALQTASKDATLKSLKVSPGQLSPAFSPDVDTYGVTVGTDVDKLVISADTTDENAAKVISGNEELQMGENRVTCKVTAQDGETAKEYVIVVTKAEGGESTEAASPDVSADSDQQVKMEITKRTITILSPDDSVKVPDGFKPTTINIDGHKVKGWVWGADKDPQYCVVYGMNEAGEKNLYRYDMKDSERTIQRYFEDPIANNMVTPEQYNTLAAQYDKVREDFNLFRILLAATVAIAVILFIILLVVILNKKGKGGNGDDPSGPRDGQSRSSRQKKQSGYQEADGYRGRGKQNDAYDQEDYDQEDYDQEYGDEYEEPDHESQRSGTRHGYGYHIEHEDEDAYVNMDESGYRDDDGYEEQPFPRNSEGYVDSDSPRSASGLKDRQGSRQPVHPQVRDAQPSRPTAPPLRDTQPSRPTAPPLRDAQPSRPTAPPLRDTQPSRPTAPPLRDTQPSRPTPPPLRDTQLSRPTAPPLREAQPSRPTAPPLREAQPSRPTAPPPRDAQPSRISPDAAQSQEDEDFEIFDL